MRHATACAALVLAALGVAACTTGATQDRAALCPTVDWYEYGRNDARLGVPASERTELFADCRELGYAPDVAAYRAGRAEGLRAYCTLENGYELGLQGRRYRDVCPPELEIAFLQGYNEGRRERGRSYRVRPRFGFSLGIGHFSGHHHFSPFHHWWFGHRHYSRRHHAHRHRHRDLSDGGVSDGGVSDGGVSGGAGQGSAIEREGE